MITEREAYQRIQRRDVDVGPLRIRRVEAELFPKEDRGRHDFTVELEWEGRRHGFLVECKSNSTPKQLRAAMAQAQNYARGRSSLRPMVVVPYLSREDVDYLISQDVSGIDLDTTLAPAEIAEPKDVPVFVPHPFTFIVLKLFAYRDRKDDPDVDFGQHHAYDLYRAVAMMTEEDWRVAHRLRDTYEHEEEIQEGPSHCF